MGCVRDDALLCVYPSRVEVIGKKCGIYELAGEKFTETEKVILHTRSELTICRDTVDQGVQELERILQFGAQVLMFLRTQKFGSNGCMSLEQSFKNLLSGFPLPFRSRFSCTYELVGDFSQCADHHDGSI